MTGKGLENADQLTELNNVLVQNAFEKQIGSDVTKELGIKDEEEKGYLSQALREDLFDPLKLDATDTSERQQALQQKKEQVIQGVEDKIATLKEEIRKAKAEESVEGQKLTIQEAKAAIGKLRYEIENDLGIPHFTEMTDSQTQAPEKAGGKTPEKVEKQAPVSPEVKEALEAFKTNPKVIELEKKGAGDLVQSMIKGLLEKIAEFLTGLGLPNFFGDVFAKMEGYKQVDGLSVEQSKLLVDKTFDALKKYTGNGISKLSVKNKMEIVSAMESSGLSLTTSTGTDETSNIVFLAPDIVDFIFTGNESLLASFPEGYDEKLKIMRGKYLALKGTDAFQNSTLKGKLVDIFTIEEGDADTYLPEYAAYIPPEPEKTPTGEQPQKQSETSEERVTRRGQESIEAKRIDEAIQTAENENKKTQYNTVLQTYLITKRDTIKDITTQVKNKQDELKSTIDSQDREIAIQEELIKTEGGKEPEGTFIKNAKKTLEEAQKKKAEAEAQLKSLDAIPKKIGAELAKFKTDTSGVIIEPKTAQDALKAYHDAEDALILAGLIGTKAPAVSPQSASFEGQESWDGALDPRDQRNLVYSPDGKLYRKTSDGTNIYKRIRYQDSKLIREKWPWADSIDKTSVELIQEGYKIVTSADAEKIATGISLARKGNIESKIVIPKAKIAPKLHEIKDTEAVTIVEPPLDPVDTANILFLQGKFYQHGFSGTPKAFELQFKDGKLIKSGTEKTLNNSGKLVYTLKENGYKVANKAVIEQALQSFSPEKIPSKDRGLFVHPCDLNGLLHEVKTNS